MASNPYSGIETGEAGQIGWRIHYFEETGSTQHVAAELAAQGAAQGTIVIAEAQTAGRGRLGRSWHSPAGMNLYATIILRPRIPMGEVPRLSLVAGVAAAEALETVATGLVGLKWPNDIWLRERKAGGIIAEAVSASDHQLACVLLGIGINVNIGVSDVPPELREKATSVRIATGRRCDRIALASTLFNRLQSRYMEIEEGRFDGIRDAYDRFLAIKGKTVVVADPGTRQTGIVAGTDIDGALLLDTPSGRIRVLAGDVTIEGAYE